jgi:arabinose-5-phosphate isomerase
MDKIKSYAKNVFEIEAEAIEQASSRLDGDFSKAVKELLICKGRVIVCGMGKSGIIGRKISSTFSSTGTPSFFMHPAEAFHGDLGILKKADILLFISYSGETEEILRLISFLRENGNVIISMTGNPKSTLAINSNYHLDVSVKREACPLQMAPTSSTTVALVMGDALSVALMKEKEFAVEDFAKFHPGGSLGRKILTRVKDVMVTKNLPIVRTHTSMKEVITIMTSTRFGTAIVLDDCQHVIGVITDGDLRRALNEHENILTLMVGNIMTKQPKMISKDTKLIDAEKFIQKHEVVTLIVSDDSRRLLGLLQYHKI